TAVSRARAAGSIAANGPLIAIPPGFGPGTSCTIDRARRPSRGSALPGVVVGPVGADELVDAPAEVVVQVDELHAVPQHARRFGGLPAPHLHRCRHPAEADAHRDVLAQLEELGALDAGTRDRHVEQAADGLAPVGA